MNDQAIDKLKAEADELFQRCHAELAEIKQQLKELENSDGRSSHTSANRRWINRYLRDHKTDHAEQTEQSEI